MDDKTFKAYQAIGNNFGISADEVGRIIESALIQATEEIKSYGIKNAKTPIYISQVKIPSLSERIRMYVEKEVMRNGRDYETAKSHSTRTKYHTTGTR